MEYIVSITPEGEEENEYSTPCVFTFHNSVDAMDFANSVLLHGEVVIELSKNKA